MRATDVATLRAMAEPGASCPTGRLPEAVGESCWEIVAGAEEREFLEPAPPAAQRLTPTGTGGCCACCPGCGSGDVLYYTGTGCPPTGTPRFERTCCPVGALGAQSGYGRWRTFFRPSFSSCPIASDYEMWWAHSGTVLERTWRRREYNRTTCALQLEQTLVLPEVVGPLTCLNRVLYAEPLNQAIVQGFSGAGCPSPVPGCTPLEYDQTEGPGGGFYTSVTRRFDGDTCYVSERRNAVTARTVVRAGACASRCTAGVLVPPIPLPPSGGDGAAGPGGLIVPGRAVIVPGGGTGIVGHSSYRVTGNGGKGGGGCSGCGGDGGL